MGVYIPNMSKPKFCKCKEYNCFAWDDEKFKCKITEWKKPCPLIEIDLVRCKDCKHYDTDSRSFPCCTDIFGAVRYMEADGFCSKGERRADEN